MSGTSTTPSLGDIMLITIQKVVETPGTMLGAFQLGIHKSLQLSTYKHDLALGDGNGHLQITFYHAMYICHV